MRVVLESPLNAENSSLQLAPFCNTSLVRMRVRAHTTLLFLPIGKKETDRALRGCAAQREH
jgi:hypothetical protein